MKRLRKKLLTIKEYCDYLHLHAPDVFTILKKESRPKLVKFLETLRNAVALEKKCVLIDFSGTKRMVSDGTLLFRAELQRLLQITKYSIKIRCKPPHNARVSEVLQKVGIYDLLKHKNNISPHLPDVVHWRVAVGAGADGEKYDAILGHYDGIIPQPLQTGLYLGLTEAMTNAQHHAYIAQRQDGITYSPAKKEWWMFSQERDGRLYVAFCDLGIGIPESLPLQKPNLWKRIKSKIGVPDDSQVIYEAIQESRTRTLKHYRGKGLKQLVSVVDSVDNGSLFIFSNMGCYTLRDGEEQLMNYGSSILGTLISWSVPIART